MGDQRFGAVRPRPLKQGFDKVDGFIGGETDQWYPLIYDGAIKVEAPKMDNYHFTVDMTNQAING